MTPLHYAVRSRRIEAVELLLAHGADTNAADKNGETPLSVAVNKEDAFSQCFPVKSGRKAIIKALLTHGARIKNISEAIAAGDLNTVKSLISSNPDLPVITGKDNGETLLWRAVYWDHKDLVEFLISNGADVNGKCESGTPLHVSSMNGSSEITELLISRGAHVNSVAWSGTDTPLCYVVLYGDNRVFYRSKDPKSGKENYQVIPWETNTGENHIKVGKLLIAAGAVVNLKSHYTPLHAAIIKNWKEMAELLISAGADVNSQDDELQSTPLHIAAEYGYKDIVELLISKGADVNVNDKNGKTPLTLASENGWKLIVDLLRRHGGRE
jgi:ankyrin repeat protein